MSSRTYLNINDIRLYAPIGVSAQEQRVGTLISVSVELHYDAAAAMSSDSIAHALNYADVIDMIKSILSQPISLVERAAQLIRLNLTRHYPSITSGRVVVSKPHPPVSGTGPSVSFTLEW